MNRVAIVCAMALMISELSSGQGFYGVHSPDGLKVWAVGDAGNVFYSTNSGASWASYTQGSQTLRSVWTMGNMVWIVGDNGVLQRSTNGGSTWSFATINGGIHLRAVQFVSLLTGWVAGSNGTINRTTDGGLTWVPQALGTTSKVFAVAFADSLAGYAVGASGMIAQTINGGLTWELLQQDLIVGKDLSDVGVHGDVVYVTGADGNCLKSENAGRSWVALNFKTDSQSDVTGVHVFSADSAYFIGGGGYIRETGNGGRTFRWAVHPMHAPLSHIYFYDRSRGWAVSNKNKAVIRTSDGGTTWSLPTGTTVTSAWTQKLSASSSIGNTFVISPVDKNKLYVALGRFIYMSADLGETWAQTAIISPTSGSTHSFYISPKDTNHYVVAFTGGGDRIMRSTDRGLTWTTTIIRNFSAFGMPMEMDGSHPDTLFFGPEDGYLYRSTDFGATWNTLSQPGFTSPCDLQVVRDSANIIWVGDSGPSRISRSTDGGATFSLVYNGGTSEIPTIANSSLQNSVGYATAWGSGGLQKTSNHGLSWSAVSSTGSTWGVDIAKDDPNVVMFGVYGGGTSYLSNNAGQNFSTSSLTGSNYAILAYDRATFLAQQSGGVWKYGFTYSVPTSNVQAVSVVSPSGGETWQYGTTQQITWTSSNLTNIRIEYTTGPGQPWQVIAGSTPAAAGAFSWTVPNASTSAARIRIIDPADGNPADTSAAPFSITVPSVTSSPATLSFGPVGIGTGQRDTVVITNSGTATLVIYSVTTTTGYFVAGRTSFTIPAGSSDTLGVVFQPDSLQTYYDTLRISTNAPTASVTVPLVGTGVPAVSVGGDDPAPITFRLEQNYPNPFNPSTSISYALPAEGFVTLRVYNTLGQEVATLVNETQMPGRYSVRFPLEATDSRGLPSGIYFYRLQAGEYLSLRKMILLK